MVTTATVVVERVADAMAWSVDMATHVEKVTGKPASVWSSVYGQMGEIGWIGVVDDCRGRDASGDAINGDAGTRAAEGHGGPVHPGLGPRGPLHPHRLTALPAP